MDKSTFSDFVACGIGGDTIHKALLMKKSNRNILKKV